MQPRGLILLERRLAEQFSQFARSHAPHQIHLKEAILGVKETQRAGGIQAVGGTDRGGAQRVPLDDHASAQTR